MPWITTTDVRQIQRFHCDCATPEPPQTSCYRCTLCRRETCRHCGLYDAREVGNHRDWYCRACWDLGEPYRVQVETLRVTCQQPRPEGRGLEDSDRETRAFASKFRVP